MSGAAADRLAEELARHRYELTVDDMQDPTPWEDLPATYRNDCLASSRRILAWLAERGRLVPDGAGVEEQWAAEVTFADGDVEHWVDIEAVARSMAAPHRSANRGKRRLVHRTVITTPWEPVPEETT